MASLNTKTSSTRKPQLPPQSIGSDSNYLHTHAGAPAFAISPELALRRSVCSCLLWEDTFYEDGSAIADRIVSLVKLVPPKVVADLAIDARSSFNLRHVPLLLVAALAAPKKSGTSLISETLAEIIQRADEIPEFLSVYAKVYGFEPSAIKKHLSAQVKKGLAKAFAKFDAYQLAKYNRDTPIQLRDVGFLTHVKSGSPERGQLNANLFNKDFFPEATKSSGFRVKDEYELTGKPNLAAADTWEVALSAGADKKETFTRQLQENKLGYLALLRNLRNMIEAGVDTGLIEDAILARRGARRVLPFRYVAAARAAPSLAPAIDTALQAAVADLILLEGKTAILVDVSGSMGTQLSSRSDLTRIDAAAALASVIHSENLRVFTFSDYCVEVPPIRGLAGINGIIKSQLHNGTYLGGAINAVQGTPSPPEPDYNRYRVNRLDRRFVPRMPLPEFEPASNLDRLIVITDEQTADRIPEPRAKHAYMINVASYRNGVGYGPAWTHIDGFSEQVLRFITEFEKLS